VEGVLGLNEFDNAHLPIQVEKASGKKMLNLLLRRQGYLPGEVIDFRVTIKAKKRQSTHLILTLVKVMSTQLRQLNYLRYKNSIPVPLSTGGATVCKNVWEIWKKEK